MDTHGGRRALGSLALCTAVLLGACGGDGDTAGGGTEPIKIGVNVELSGSASVLGQAFADAAKLRAREINEQEGGILNRRVELARALAPEPRALLLDEPMAGLSDHVVVLDDHGSVLAEGTPAQIRADERVVAAYLGEAA